jgi:TPR repeat protein
MNLGVAFVAGEMIQQNVPQGMALLKKAATTGYAPAEFRYGKALVDQDPKLAIRLLSDAAYNGVVEAFGPYAEMLEQDPSSDPVEATFFAGMSIGAGATDQKEKAAALMASLSQDQRNVVLERIQNWRPTPKGINLLGY